MPRFAIHPLAPAALPEARDLLARACAFDAAAEVAEEKLFAPGAAPAAPIAWIARDDAGTPLGVAATCARWLRLLAVRPDARGAGVGSALLAIAEDAMRADGVTSARALSQPGNYLAPGIDEHNVETIAWLERRGWVRGTERTHNIHVRVRDNPRVSAARAAQLADDARGRGYTIRRGRRDERAALAAAIAAEFGGAWPFEVARALAFDPPGVHVAIHAGGTAAYAAFAAHDGNNQGLGWFGPAGTWPAHRGQGLGEAVLLACLVDVAAAHDRCEVAWIGPRPFYDKVAGVDADRRFWPMTKSLAP